MWWIDGLGYLGAALTIATYAVNTMIPLRIIGLCSSFTFLTYSLVTSDYPTVLMDCVLLPLNGFKLYQMVQLTRQVKEAASSDFSMEWLRPFATRRKIGAGDVLFRKGDEATAMFYIDSGRFRLIEAGIELTAGQLVGELGLVAPGNRRTQGLECIEPGELLKVTYSDFEQLYFQNPKFGFYFLRLVSERLLSNAESAAAGKAIASPSAEAIAAQ
ncbi:MAG TPA: cyclic nucleotide-binding domain-containing protein [Reyranella sp.]